MYGLGNYCTYQKIYINHYMYSPLNTIFCFFFVLDKNDYLGDSATFYSECSCDCLDDIERVNTNIIAS